MAEELSVIIRGAMPSWSEPQAKDCIEISNLLICGAYLLQSRFIGNGQIERILDEISAQSLTYFKYITLKYCYLRDTIKFKLQLESLNAKAASRLTSLDEIKQKSELFHLLCDFLGAPDVPLATKRTVYVRLYGGAPSNAALAKLSDSIGFIDWSGVSIEHSLKRRQMRPVYAVA
jgi:hypothetical protein